MAEIDMVNPGVLGGNSPESTVQSGGGGQIDMANHDLSLSHTPISSVQKGGGSGTIDMVGEQGMLNRSPATIYNDVGPKDKGE